MEATKEMIRVVLEREANNIRVAANSLDNKISAINCHFDACLVQNLVEAMGQNIAEIKTLLEEYKKAKR